jgi:uncharacterized membrane protein YgcG
MQVKSSPPHIYLASNQKTWDHAGKGKQKMTALISIIVMVAALWFIVGFLNKRKAKKAAEQTAWEEEQLRESRLKSREAELKYRLYQASPRETISTTRTYVGDHGHVVNYTTISQRPSSTENYALSVEDQNLIDLFKANNNHKLLPGNPFLANNMTQRALFMRKHSANPDKIKEAMVEAEVKYPFDLHSDYVLLKKVSSGNTVNKKWGDTYMSNDSPYDGSILNTILATAVINDGFISSDSTRSEPDTFSGGGGSFGGGGSSGSWDSNSNSDSSSSSSYDSGSSPSYDSGGGFDSGGGSFGSD